MKTLMKIRDSWHSLWHSLWHCLKHLGYSQWDVE
ncbi:hypothetical protein C8J23_1269 [Shewanella chilikensis]|jgi:hypothetical protein|uniref:Uncharacterized protein n=1 Tax=Shewanella chilikensis TaxID=558541 RepID=A0ABX5PKH4_9GAMM|nr:hypothetical protein [Shewanella sp.]PYE56920.1 hypothetical protein C8J23_1269 [Shewanella chilikensis]